MDLENKLRKEEEEMRELLRQKHWYKQYLLKINEDKTKS
jgi:hypothetical protein